MKNILLITTTAALFVVLASSVAMAEDKPLKGYTTFEFSSEYNRDTDKDNVKGNIVVGLKDPNNGMDYSFSAENSQAEYGNGNIGGLFEVRVKKTLSDQKLLGIFTPFVGGRLGSKVSNKSSFMFYAVDTGVNFPIDGDFSGTVGARYRNSFGDENFETVRFNAGIKYSISEHNSVGLGYNTSFGDEGKNAFSVNYTRTF